MALKSSASILVIDDEASLLRSITAYLEDSGYIAKGAENGKEGLEIFERDNPDIVLTDLHMPVLGGLEVLRTISSKSPDIPVIVISGAGELSDAIEALRFGAWDFITKPIADLQVLEHAIKKALEQKRLVEENRKYAQRVEQHLKILEEDQVAGRRVQMSLLPRDQIVVNNFEFKFKIIPSLELSGDFVEYFKIDATHIGVYLADVSGHGASSAFITILLKSIISKYQVQFNANNDDTIIQPDKLMQAISNEIFAAKLNKYITLIYGVINIATSEFCYGVGGHYPNPILYSKGTAKILDGIGFPIGIMDNIQFQQHTIKLNPGEYIVMLSDGVMEVYMQGHRLAEKEAGLLKAIETSKGDISTLLRASGVTTKTNIKQPDDITILVISHL